MGGCLSGPDDDAMSAPVESKAVLAPMDLEGALNGDQDLMRILFSRIDVKEMTGAVDAIANVFMYQNQIDDLLQFVLYEEAQKAIKNGNMFLRIPSLGTRLLHRVFKLNGGLAYIKQVCRPTLIDILDKEEDINFELDPRKLKAVYGDEIDEEEYRQRHMDSLGEYCNQILERLMQYGLRSEEKADDTIPVPYVMGLMGYLIRENVTKEMPEYDPVLAAVSFLFLRTLCPTVICPNTIDCDFVIDQDVTISKAAQRNLVLLAKTLQNVSSNQEQGIKAPHMAMTNDFIRESHPNVREFVDSLSETHPDNFSAEECPINYISREESFATITQEKYQKSKDFLEKFRGN